jgi:hypothetical protein
MTSESGGFLLQRNRPKLVNNLIYAVVVSRNVPTKLSLKAAMPMTHYAQSLIKFLAGRAVGVQLAVKEWVKTCGMEWACVATPKGDVVLFN